jgi:hypothetical protein
VTPHYAVFTAVLQPCKFLGTDPKTSGQIPDICNEIQIFPGYVRHKTLTVS